MAIEDLRVELEDLDEEILRLVSRRQDVALEIGRLKANQGLPIRDYGREKVVVDRMIKAAGRLGLPPDLARRLALDLIEASLTAQEKSHVIRQGRGSGRRALVFGGAGKMGGWMTRFLASQGFEVEIADPAGGQSEFPRLVDWKSSPLDHDVVVVAAPLRASREILEALVEIRPPGLVFDIGSLKSPLREPLRRLAGIGVKVASIHPMFGPDTELLSGRHIIFVDLGVPEAIREARALFESTMAAPVEMSLETHDKVIAYVLGLSHAVNIAFFTALGESGETADQLAEVSSTTFDAQLNVAANVAKENPQLYFEIQSLNDFGVQALDALVSSVQAVRRAVIDRDGPAFSTLMERGRVYFEGHRIGRRHGGA